MGGGGRRGVRKHNGAGSVALVASETCCGVLALIGRWPSRIAVSGNEVAWSEVRETLDSQIDAARAGDEPAGAIAELELLRDRLITLKQSGSAPEHPAESYIRAVGEALQRAAGTGIRLHRRGPYARNAPDFVLERGGRRVLVKNEVAC